MESFTSKLDIDLIMIYMKFEADKKNGQPESDAPAYNLSLRYEDNLSEIEKLGFETTTNQLEGFASGNAKLQDIERIASHPGVLSLSYGSKKHKSLDKSVRDMVVRTDNIADLGTKGLWRADTTTGVITSLAAPNNHTGKGVIVGVIDSGIDIEHPVFSEGSVFAYTSRILKYWDQGLKPADAGGRAGPDVALLGGGSAKSYGVEFDRTIIETFLNGMDACPSKDCVGHGTHVAGIAAGNGRPGDHDISSSPVDFIGVAPQADIVAVKFLDTPDEIKDTAGNIVSSTSQFRDAIMYILQVAKSAGKPAVINCSFGGSLGPHDGLTEDEQFLDKLFDSAGEWYSGNIVVFAAGNEAGSWQHAEITIPALGEIVIPYTLYDGRKNPVTFEHCKWVDDTPLVFAEVWYKEVTAPADVSVQIKVPGDSAFSAEVFSGFLEKTYDKNKTRLVVHEAQPVVKRPDNIGGTIDVKRNMIRMVVVGNTKVVPGQHKRGLYELKIKGPAGTVMQTYVTQGTVGFIIGTNTRLTVNAALNDIKLVVHDANAFKVNDAVELELDDGTRHLAVIKKVTIGLAPDTDEIEIDPKLPSQASVDKRIKGVLPAEIKIEDRLLIPDNGGAKMCITVAAYDDNNGTAGSPHGKLAKFSSVGPLADYSGLGPYAIKPEIAGPGIAINSALSKDMNGGVGLKLSQLFGDRWVEFQGTSMAAPHIAGLIALMLEKNKALNVDQVRTIFLNTVNNRDGEGPVSADGVVFTESFGGGLADGVKIINATP